MGKTSNYLYKYLILLATIIAIFIMFIITTPNRNSSVYMEPQRAILIDGSIKYFTSVEFDDNLCQFFNMNGKISFQSPYENIVILEDNELWMGRNSNN